MNTDYNAKIKDCATVKIIKKPKLNAEKRPIYERVFPLTWVVYSRNVIRLASEEISVPAPPMFTPSKSSR